MAQSVRPTSKDGFTDSRIGAVLVLDMDETAALASLLYQLSDTNPIMVAPNHMEHLLAIRKATYGY